MRNIEKYLSLKEDSKLIKNKESRGKGKKKSSEV